MDYLTIKIIHSATSALLLLGLIAHIFMLFKAARSQDAAVLARKLGNTRRFSAPALAVIGLSLPVTGWFLVNMAGFALSQLWLLLSAILMVVLVLLYVLLVQRLRVWAAGDGSAAPHAGFCAGLMLVIVIAIFALMGAKPM